MNTITLPQKPKKEIEIKLITDLGEEYHLSQTNFNLPLDCTSEKLNELVNKMLKLSSPKKFSFFINNIKLTTSLTEFVNTNMISTENVVEIFYMFEMNEPQLKNTIKEYLNIFYPFIFLYCILQLRSIHFKHIKYLNYIFC